MPETEQELKRLQYRSIHRGCKETDLIFAKFAEQRLSTLTQQERAVYAQLLEEDDVYIWDWLLGNTPPPPSYALLIAALRACTPVTP